MPPAVRKACVPALVALALACVLASIVAACGSENRGITEPTALSEVVVHNTLNRADNRSLLELRYSNDATSYLPMVSTLLPWAWDDFTSPVDTTIRTVSWQGAYCRSWQGLSPPGPPLTVAKSFRVSFEADRNGRPSTFGGGPYAFTLTPVDAHEQFAFDGVWNESDCAYYDYTAVLPMPLPVTASTRYWLLIRAVTDSTWGWRIGTQDNGVSASGSLYSGINTSAKDLAFSLSTSEDRSASRRRL